MLKRLIIGREGGGADDCAVMESTVTSVARYKTMPAPTEFAGPSWMQNMLAFAVRRLRWLHWNSSVWLA